MRRSEAARYPLIEGLVAAATAAFKAAARIFIGATCDCAQTVHALGTNHLQVLEPHLGVGLLPAAPDRTCSMKALSTSSRGARLP